MSSLRSILLQLDQFRIVPVDFSRGTVTGGSLTVLAWGLMVVLLIAEISAFVMPSFQTKMLLDEIKNPRLPINFDITMHELPCRHLQLSVWDKFGEQKVQGTDEFKYFVVDHTGQQTGVSFTPEDIKMLALANEERRSADDKDEQANLEPNWSSTTAEFRHSTLEEAVTRHDHTFVMFFADWCSHSKKLAPMWDEAARIMGDKKEFTNSHDWPASVKFMKMNCAEFDNKCIEAKVNAFPTLRLYNKKDGSYQDFADKRSVGNIRNFLNKYVSKFHLVAGGGEHGAVTTEGCRVAGTIEVPRVPGHLHLQAESFGDVSLNRALTNVSHLVSHLSFGNVSAMVEAENSYIPQDMLTHIRPLDGESFVVRHFHEAPQHHLKVVATHVEGNQFNFYQMTHTDRTRKLQEDSQLAPQARFSFEFAPMAVHVKSTSKKWYHFLTTLFAILGGTYSICEMSTGVINTVQTNVKEVLGKES